MVTGWEVYMQQRRSTLVTWSALYTVRHHHSISSSAFPSYHLHNFRDYRCLHNRGTLKPNGDHRDENGTIETTGLSVVQNRGYGKLIRYLLQAGRVNRDF